MAYFVKQAEFLTDTVKRLRIYAPDICRNAQAGQFVIVRQDERSERIPLTVVECVAESQTITVVVQAAGDATRRLCGLQDGDALQDVLGPLGNPAPVRRYGTVACVAGGVGIAEIYPLTGALRRAGNRIVSILGGRSAAQLIFVPEITADSDVVLITTDDGSAGEKGVVTDPLRRCLVQEPVDAVFCVGPVAMMAAVAECTRPTAIKTIASLNAIMVDGTGMCGSCRVNVDGRTQFACVDGPDFDAHQVDFHQLQQRQQRFARADKLYNGKRDV